MSGTSYHRLRRQNERLVGFECQDCGWVAYPEEKRVCKRCSAAPAEFEAVQLAERGTVESFVVQERLPDEFASSQPLAIVDIPQAAAVDDPSADAEPARVYGLLTETSLDDLAVGVEVEARFRELFTVGDRPIHSFTFAVPRTEKTTPENGGDEGGVADD